MNELQLIYFILILYEKNLKTNSNWNQKNEMVWIIKLLKETFLFQFKSITFMNSFIVLIAIIICEWVQFILRTKLLNVIILFKLNQMILNIFCSLIQESQIIFFFLLKQSN